MDNLVINAGVGGAVTKRVKTKRNGKRPSSQPDSSAEVQCKPAEQKKTEAEGCPDPRIEAIARTDILAEVSKLSSSKKYQGMVEKVMMVVRAFSHAMMAAGEPGVAKSTLILATLIAEGLKEGVHFVVVRGYSTPLALYEQLLRHNGKIIVVDDCDGVFRNSISLDILKAALDDKFQRTISYATQRQSKDIAKSFVFTGRVIFVTNYRSRQNDAHFAAIEDRCLVQTLYLSAREKLEYIERIILPSDYKTTTLEDRKKVFGLMEDIILAKGGLNFSFRTYLKALDHFIFNPQSIHIHLRELIQCETEATLLMNLRKESTDKEYWMTEFMKITGKSRRTYFNWLKKVKELQPLPSEQT
jgi:hypothetical protein